MKRGNSNKESDVPERGNASGFFNNFIGGAKSVFYLLSGKKKRDMGSLEKLAVINERKQAKLIKEIRTRKERIDRKRTELTKKIESEAHAVNFKLDRQLEAIQRSGETSFKRLSRVHNFLRAKSKFYYIWHLNPYSSFLNLGALVLFITASIFASRLFYQPMRQKVLAQAPECYWVAKDNPANFSDPQNWANISGGDPGSCRGGRIPGKGATIILDSTSQNDLVLDTSISIDGITNLGDESGYAGKIIAQDKNIELAKGLTFKGGRLEMGSGTWTVAGTINTIGAQVDPGSANLDITGEPKTLAEKDTSKTLTTKDNETEDINARTETSKKFQIGTDEEKNDKTKDKKFRVASSLGPIHYKLDPDNKDEKFKEIDLSIRENNGNVKNKDPDYYMEQNDYSAYFWNTKKSDSEQALMVGQFKRLGKYIQMAPTQLVWENSKGERQIISTPQTKDEPEIDNDNYTITWKNAFGEGLDFRYNVSPDRFFKTVIVNKKENLPEATIDKDGLKLTVIMALSWQEDAQPQTDFAQDIKTQSIEAAAQAESAPSGEAVKQKSTPTPAPTSTLAPAEPTQSATVEVVESPTPTATATTVSFTSSSVEKWLFGRALAATPATAASSVIASEAKQSDGEIAASGTPRNDTKGQVEQAPQPTEQLSNPSEFAFKNETNDQDLWWIQRPQAWDSGENQNAFDLEQKLLRLDDKVYADISLPADKLTEQITYPLNLDTTMSTKQILANGDNAFWFPSDPTQFVTGFNWVRFGNYGGAVYDSWLRFQLVPLPQGATIDSANLKFNAYGTGGGNSTDTCNATIKTESSGNATQYTSVGGITGATWSAGTNWNAIPHWVDDGVTWHTSPDIKSDVQTVVSNSGWAPGNAMGFTVWDNSSSAGAARSQVSYDYSSARAAKFEATYTLPTPTSTTRTWDGGGANANWSTAGNWTGDVAPITGDDIVFDGTACGANCNATVDSSFTANPATISANAGYTGIVTQLTNLSTSGNTGNITINAGTWNIGTNNLNANGGNVTIGATVNIGASTVSGLTANNLTISTGKTFTASGNSKISISGNWQNDGTFAKSTSTVIFNGAGAQTITAGGVTSAKQFNNITIANTSASSVTLLDDLYSTGTMELMIGTLDTNQKTVTAGYFSSSGTNTRALNITNSQITLTSDGLYVPYGGTGFTLTSTGSTITLTGSSAVFQGGAKTWNTVVFTGGGTNMRLLDTNTFANLTVTGTTSKTDNINAGHDQIITGSLTLTGDSTTNRLLFNSNNLTNRTYTVSLATVSANNVDFQNIILNNGGGGDIDLTNGGANLIGNCGQNSGAIFTADADQHWKNDATGEWDDESAVWTSRAPLPQDNVYIDTAFTTTRTITVNMPRMGKNIVFSSASNKPNVLMNVSPLTYTIYGSLDLTGVGTTFTHSRVTYFQGYSDSTLTSAGKTFNEVIYIQMRLAGSNLTLADAFYSTKQLYMSSGTLTASSGGVSCYYFQSSSGSTVNMGSGTWDITGNSGFSGGEGTIVKNTSTIYLSYAGTTAATFYGHGNSFNNITIASGTGTAASITFRDSFTFNNMTMYSNTASREIRFYEGETFTMQGVHFLSGNATYPVTVRSTSDLNVVANITKSSGIVSGEYLTMNDIVAINTGATYYAGSHSTLDAQSTGWTQTGARTVRPAGGNWSASTTWYENIVPTSADKVFGTTGDGNLTIDATAQASTVDLLSGYTGTFTLAPGTSPRNSLTTTGNMTIASGANFSFTSDHDGTPVEGGWGTLNVGGNLTNAGTISSNAQGYSAETGYTGGKGVSGGSCGGGGAFGGNGAAGASGCNGGTAYGAPNDANYVGSGGGQPTGGAGGGHIHIIATGNLTNTGTISSNGGNATSNGGGGAGGGVYLQQVNFTNTGGTVAANGGNGDANGGGGGGGRIYINSSGTNTVGTLSATGGTGYNSGSGGTYMYAPSPSSPALSTPANNATNQYQNLSSGTTGIRFSSIDSEGNYLRYKIEMSIEPSGSFADSAYVYTLTQGATVGEQTVSQTKQSIPLTVTYMGAGCSGAPEAQGGTAYNSGTVACASIDTTTPLKQGQKYYWRVSAIDPGGANIYVLSASAFNFTVSAINKNVLTAGTAQTIRAADSSTCSAVITFEVRNVLNEAVKMGTNRQVTSTFTLSDGGVSGDFYSNSSCSSALPSDQVTVAAGSATGSFYYKNTHSSSSAYTLSVSETPSQGWTDSTTTIQVNPGNLNHYTFAGYNVPSMTKTTDDVFSATITAYDSQNNVKFDYYGTSAKVWFTSTADSYLYPTILPAYLTSKYQFVAGDQGVKTFTNGFQIRKTGTQTITFKQDPFDGYNLDMTTANFTLNPGALANFTMTQYPLMTGNLSEFAISGAIWDSGGVNAPYKPKVTVRDSYSNIKTDYTGELWFNLLTSDQQETDHTFTYNSIDTAYTFIPGDSGVKEFASADFLSNTSGRNMQFIPTNGTVSNTNLKIYIKPKGLSDFSITTSSTLSRGGTLNDQDIDSEWDHDAAPVDITVTALDATGQVKTNYGYDVDDEDHVAGEGYVYFYTPERPSYLSDTLKTSQEFPYQKISAADTTSCFPFPAVSAGVHTFNQTEVPELFNWYKGGQRTIYVAECITPDSTYATTKEKKDPNFPDAAWDTRANNVATGVIPASSTIATATHPPGTTHEDDQHSDNANNNFTIGPGDTKLSLSWKNPFDAPVGNEAKVHILQSTNGVDFTDLTSPRPLVNAAGDWQSQDVTGLVNDQDYWYKLKIGYKRADGSEILSDESITLTAVPKQIAPVDVTAVQLDRTDPTHPGQVTTSYALRFNSTVSFSYFDPSHVGDPVTQGWYPISDAAVTGDKGVLNGNFDEPISHTTYLDLNTNFDGQYLGTSFMIRINVTVVGQGSSYSPSPTMRLDTKNPASTTLVVDATGNSTATLSINATDNSPPIQMMISNRSDYSGAAWETYATSKTGYSIAGASSVYIKFRDLYYNVTPVSTAIRPIVTSLQIRDASNIPTSKYRLITIWDDATNVDHYNVWRSSNGIDYTKIDTTTKNGYLDINLDSSLTYAYKITSEDAFHNVSLPAGPVSARPGSAPSVTQDPTVELFGWKQDQGVRAKISWNTNQSSDSNVAYSTGVLHEGADMTADGAVVKINTSPDLVSAHEVWIYNLEPSTKYYFKAFSKNEIQIAGYSSVADFTTPERIPLLISGMKISDITMTGALATWTTSKSATTKLEYGPSESYGSTLTDDNFNVDHTFKLNDLSSGTKYYLRASNTDSDGNITVSDQYEFETPAMPIVSGVSVKEAAFNSATIDWSTNVNCDSNVEYGLTSLNATQGKADSTTVHSVTLIGLEAKTSYNFRVISKDQFGNVATSDTSSFVTAADTTAPKISNIKSEVASTGSGDAIKYQAIISWDTDEPATSQIEFAQSIGGDYTDKTEEIPSLNSSHVVILPDLKPNSAYHFRVVSKDKVGNTANSDDISLITPPKEKSLLQIILKSLEETFSWVGRLKDKWTKK